jgi:hypothetical protein
MDALRAAALALGSIAVAAATALRRSLRAVIGWTVGIASRQVELVAILSQSLTLLLLSVAIAHLRKPSARR